MDEARGGLRRGQGSHQPNTAHSAKSALSLSPECTVLSPLAFDRARRDRVGGGGGKQPGLVVIVGAAAVAGSGTPSVLVFERRGLGGIRLCSKLRGGAQFRA